MTAKTNIVVSHIANGVRTKQELMEKMETSLASITGVIAAAKRLGLVEVSETGLITVTEAGTAMIAAAEEQAAAPKRENKAALTKDLYVQLMAEGKRRCEIVVAFMERFGMSKAAASTYLQNAKKATSPTVAAE